VDHVAQNVHTRIIYDAPYDNIDAANLTDIINAMSANESQPDLFIAIGFVNQSKVTLFFSRQYFYTSAQKHFFLLKYKNIVLKKTG